MKNRQRCFGSTRGLVLLGLVTGLACGLVGGLQSGAQADTPGPHPHYLHALSDLRYSRGWLTALGENNVMGREMDAVVNIDKAIGEIKRASIDDGKDLHDHPPVDANLKHQGRLHKALDLLRSARTDLQFNEDDHAALGWRQRAIRHVDDAIKADRQAIKDIGADS